MRCFVIILLSTLLFPVIASAQCASPHAEMGVLIFNKAHKVMQYCNGDDWIGLWGGGGSVGGGGSGGGGSGDGLPSCSNGEIAQYNSGSWVCNDGSGITKLNASNLTSGIAPRARLGTGTANNTTYLRGDGTWSVPPTADLSNLNASNLTSGTIPNARFPATLPAASGVNLTNLNANNIASGTVARARLGSGTASASTYLRGDGQWVAPPTGGGISQVTTASCSGNSSVDYTCSVACPSGYYRTGCSARGGSNSQSSPSGAGCYCSTSSSTVTCYAYCAR